MLRLRHVGLAILISLLPSTQVLADMPGPDGIYHPHPRPFEGPPPPAPVVPPEAPKVKDPSPSTNDAKPGKASTSKKAASQAKKETAHKSTAK